MTVDSTFLPLSRAPDEAVRLVGESARDRLLRAYRWMVLGRTLDARMQGLQRQGRVGFYGATTGHEAVNVAAGLLSGADDWVLPGLREQLVALIRGHPLVRYVHHLFATDLDPSRGRQMPCHPSARDVQYVSMSSVIGTQITHAVGAARAMRFRKHPGAALAFFGDGATSSNDFHAGLNFAGVDRLPVLFICANNQWAISLPAERQSAVRALSDKARAYGFTGETVDGTDLFAVWAALSAALDGVRQGRGPHLIEFRLFRMTAHSSSDDPTRYQPADWNARAHAHDPVLRFERWLTEAGWLSDTERASLATEADREVRSAIEVAEATPAPAPETLFEDVFSQPLSLPEGSPPF